MQLELSSEEVKYLDNVLDRHLIGLIREISHTDSREYKTDLKGEADFVTSLKNKIGKDLPTQKAS